MLCGILGLQERSSVYFEYQEKQRILKANTECDIPDHIFQKFSHEWLSILFS
jgi:hypothetical protein